MPFTALHMGPGLAIKAVAGRRFSLIAFGIAQVAMDIEPLVGLVRDSDVLHGPTHTYLAALPIAAFVALVAPAICRPLLRRWNRELAHHRLGWLAEPDAPAPGAVLVGAFAGTLSHVLLDSIMHADIAPLAPWSGANVLRGAIAIDALNQACVVSGLLGGAAWLALAWRRRRAAAT
jgi:membrane-bound metal-dependent hydrolase YbcI (DUF457 family)